MSTAAIIVAAGRGTRAGGDLPKQWQMLNGRRVVDRTLDAFLSAPEIGQIILVLHPDDIVHSAPADGVTVVLGGETRAQSVRNGLDALTEADPAYVLIHDAARACVKPTHISDIVGALREAGARAVAPALAVTDALWRGENGTVSGTQNRDGLFRAQTPQAFVYRDIFTAHQNYTGVAADDVEVARAAGIDVKIIDGDEDNLKITGPADFSRAEKILRGQMDIRTGSGYDVHRFGPGDHVMLCGVRIPHDRGLQGHSDADVGMHALTDAIYGALAEGDIGRHFPPSDPQWKGVESHIFLRHAVQLAVEKEFYISNVDVTLICEYPKIGPHADAMRHALAEIIAIDIDRVSIKATTSERLGFTGRGEGIASQAIATLIRQ